MLLISKRKYDVISFQFILKNLISQECGKTYKGILSQYSESTDVLVPKLFCKDARILCKLLWCIGSSGEEHSDQDFDHSHILFRK